MSACWALAKSAIQTSTVLGSPVSGKVKYVWFVWVQYRFFLIFTFQLTANAVIEAQKRSSLYDTSKLAADPLIAEKKEMVKTAGKGWFDIQVTILRYSDFIFNLSKLSKRIYLL